VTVPKWMLVIMRSQIPGVRLTHYVSLVNPSLLAHLCRGGHPLGRLTPKLRPDNHGLVLGGSAPCGCRKCHPRASRCEFVFVDETTEPVGSSQSGKVWIVDRRRIRPDRLWSLLIKGTVRSVLVVVVHVLG
jgi:hypothetical protein